MCGLEFLNVLLLTLPWSFFANLLWAAVIGLSYLIVQRPPWAYMPMPGFADEVLFATLILICAWFNARMLYYFLRTRPD